jgi:hypothetical protein
MLRMGMSLNTIRHASTGYRTNIVLNATKSEMVARSVLIGTVNKTRDKVLNQALRKTPSDSSSRTLKTEIPSPKQEVVSNE